ncbi:hypothetical protein PMAYCL1PPCAC_31339, partial [Pristionchus mayeri]
RSAPNSPVISTRDGNVQGKRLVDEPGFKADAYLGIPYAQPPSGDLRFRKPVSPVKWAGTRECFEHPKKCVQIPFGMLALIDKDWPSSEDCLYLNIFCPGDYTLQDRKYPVMMFIHGGGFAAGSAMAYGDQGICEGLVRQGVIVVVVQYRLGVLGFFSTGDEACPGNFGLWDQIEALKWIQENIGQFGGDKDNVTIFGQSSGGASVDLLSLSPHAKGLIHRVIPMSGSALTPWSHRTSTADYCKSYAETKLGIKAETSEQFIAQLRNVSADLLVFEPIKEISQRETTRGFCPVIDGDLFPLPIEELRKTAPLLPVMGGLMALECGLFLPDMNITEEQIKNTIEAMLPESAVSESSESLVEMYKEVARKRQPKQALWRARVELAGDRMYNIATMDMLRKTSQRGATTYFYVFEYYNRLIFGPLAEVAPSSEASHCAELAYVFNTGVAVPFPFCDHDKKIADMMMRAFANFAKRGNPNDEGDTTWLPCDSEHLGRHMVLDLKPRMEEQFNEGRCERWLELQKK